MMFLNEYEVEQLAETFDAEDSPNLFRASRALEHLMDWTNGCSDGWHSWPLPATAAESLMGLLEQARMEYRRKGEIEDLTEKDMAKLMKPIRALLKRRGVEDPDAVLFPKPPPAPVSFAPCITGKIEAGGQVSEFMIPLDPESSTQYSQWGADNTVLWPRVELLEKLAEVAREWVLDHPEEDE